MFLFAQKNYKLPSCVWLASPYFRQLQGSTCASSTSTSASSFASALAKPAVSQLHTSIAALANRNALVPGQSLPLDHQHPGFKNFVKHLLATAEIQPDQIETLTQPKKLQTFCKAFTSASVSHENYEFLELMGDAYLNTCVVEYLHARFPQLCTPAGVKTVARLKIDHVSKQKFSYYANKLGFAKFVRCSPDQKINGNVKQSVLEDCFEAFCGAMVGMCNDLKFASGYFHCYNFVKQLMDKEHISLKNEDLFDAKTRLKELFDVLKDWKIEYEHSSIQCGPNDCKITTKIWVHNTVTKCRFLSSRGTSRTKKNSDQIAAKLAIEDLKSRGMYVETVNS